MRWRDYVMETGDDVTSLVAASGAGERPTTLIVGAGFDPRAGVGPALVADATGQSPATLVTLGLPAGPADPIADKYATRNAELLRTLAADCHWRSEALTFPDTASRRSAGQAISRGIQGSGLIDRDGVVIIDVSALPTSVAFPLIGGVFAAADRGEFRGDLLVLVCENPAIDRAIVEEGADDPGPIAGLNFGLTRSGATAIRAWSPVLGEHQAEQLAALHDHLEPDEIVPILPFPAAKS